MYTEKNVSLYHATGINSEFLPEEFAALRTNHLRILVDKALSNKVQKIDKLSTDKESEFLYTNPNHPGRKGKKAKYDFKYNTILHINKKKLIYYIHEEYYYKFFDLIYTYLSYVFNGLNKEQVKQLYIDRQITDSVYIFSMKCFEIIETNQKQYNYSKSKNLDTMIDNTEHFYHIKEVKNDNIREDILLLIVKFQSVLEVVDAFLFKECILDLKEVYEETEKTLT